MDRIGEYLVKRLIGEGGMGKVYEAEERLSKRRVALKVLRSELTRHEDGRRLFLNEIEILAKLEHPNLVRSLASIEHEGQLVMVLEFLEGRTLREELSSKGKLSLTEAVEFAAQIAGALQVAHEQSLAIVHRDLKPENVMILADRTVKVMDFGVAKVLLGASGPSTQSIGTLQYMSPEQIDAGAIDARSDLYALGLVLYEMLSGAAPFRSSSPRELLNLQCTAEPPALEVDVPQGIEDLVFLLLAKSPDERPASAADVVQALSPFRMRAQKTTSRPGRPRASAPASKPRAEKSESSESQPLGEVRPPSGTLHSSPSVAPRTDTISLVEKATAPKEVPTRWAALAILALTLVSGVVTYEVRSHYGASPAQGSTAWASAGVSEASARTPGH